jgi:hypothetical protein
MSPTFASTRASGKHRTYVGKVVTSAIYVAAFRLLLLLLLLLLLRAKKVLQSLLYVMLGDYIVTVTRHRLQPDLHANTHTHTRDAHEHTHSESSFTSPYGSSFVVIIIDRHHHHHHPTRLFRHSYCSWCCCTKQTQLESKERERKRKRCLEMIDVQQIQWCIGDRARPFRRR